MNVSVLTQNTTNILIDETFDNFNDKNDYIDLKNT